MEAPYTWRRIMSRPEILAVQLAVARIHSLRSTCIRRKVGCVLLDNEWATLATGHNGVPRRLTHCTDSPCAGAGRKSGTGLELCEAVHAEQNALLFCGDKSKIFACVVTTAPCSHCVKMLLNTPCQQIHFAEDYSHGSISRKLWESSGRTWKKIPTQLQWLSTAIIDTYNRMDPSSSSGSSGLTPLEQSIVDRGGHGGQGPNT